MLSCFKKSVDENFGVVRVLSNHLKVLGAQYHVIIVKSLVLLFANF